MSRTFRPVYATAFSYDNAGRVTQILHCKAPSTPLATYIYAYDAGGRLQTQTENGVTQTFTYDAANQVTVVTGNSSTNTYGSRQ
jgi:YD repeat-containing protein